MDFKKAILTYENNVNIYSYKSKQGSAPIMFTAVHTVEQQKDDGIKFAEPFTAAICQYVANQVNANYLIKSVDNGIDSNSLEVDDFKEVLLKYIKDNDNYTELRRDTE